MSGDSKVGNFRMTDVKALDLRILCWSRSKRRLVKSYRPAVPLSDIQQYAASESGSPPGYAGEAPKV